MDAARNSRSEGLVSKFMEGLQCEMERHSAFVFALANKCSFRFHRLKFIFYCYSVFYYGHFKIKSLQPKGGTSWYFYVVCEAQSHSFRQSTLSQLKSTPQRLKMG